MRISDWSSDVCSSDLVGNDPDRPGFNCAEQGVMGALTGVLGSLAALETIRALVPFGEDSAGKLLIVDLMSLRFRTLKLPKDPGCPARSEEHTSELQSLMRISYAVFCLKKKKQTTQARQQLNY